MTEQNNPVVTQIQHEIDKILANTLGPASQTPIYDQLAKEYDLRYNTNRYFETDLGKKLTLLHQFVPKHGA